MSEMMTTASLTADLLAMDEGEGRNLKIVNGWLARGDGVAVYESRAFDRNDFGTRQYVSYGSRAAQLETEIPPRRLPDIGGQINWPYQLIYSYRGAPLQAKQVSV